MSLEQYQASAPSTSTQSNSNERPEFEVSKYINIKLFGAIEITARVFKDPSRQRGMSQTQKEHHKNLSSVGAEKIEELLKQWLAEGKSPITIESVRDAGGNEDKTEVDEVKSILGML